MKARRREVWFVALGLCAAAGTALAQSAQTLPMEDLARRAAGALARLEFKIANEFIGEARSFGQCICIDAKRGTFLTGDVPLGVPVGELKDFVLIPASNAGKRVKAQLITRDPEENLTFIRALEPHKFQELKFASSKGLKLGQRVVAVGLMRPQFGNVPYAGTGVVAAKLRLPDEVIYVSGGELTVASSPVMTLDGKVVGIVGGQLPMLTRMTVRGRWMDTRMVGRMRTSFFVPTDEFAHVIANIPAPSQPRKLPWMGNLNFEPVTEETAAVTAGLKGRPAVMVGRVLSDSPASRAGLKQGDVIVAFAGRPLEKLPTPRLVAAGLQRQLIRHKVGEKVKVTVLRQGKETDITVTLAPRPPLPGEAPRYYNGALGIATRDLVLLERYAGRAEPLTDQGVLITAVRSKSPAADGKLQPGDLITSVNNKPIKSVAELKAVLSPLVKGDAPVTFTVKRNGMPVACVVKPPRPSPSR
ncbi:MAG: hypothetical protein B1H04_00730 [Planctomycetales bacterium 4484_123]|nr:MAG: hypothetical protein B1H04_00730 [Planctomycetales bacterium 4484_123]